MIGCSGSRGCQLTCAFPVKTFENLNGEDRAGAIGGARYLNDSLPLSALNPMLTLLQRCRRHLRPYPPPLLRPGDGARTLLLTSHEPPPSPLLLYCDLYHASP